MSTAIPQAAERLGKRRAWMKNSWLQLGPAIAEVLLAARGSARKFNPIFC